MPPHPLVTIVTPSFNQGAFIEQTIESVLAQDYPHVEYLVMDGGSTDETLDVLRRYEGRLAWVSEPDWGQSDAINKGFRRAQGEIVAWLNSDDVYLPGIVSESVAHLQAHPEVDLVYGDAQFIDGTGEIIASEVRGKPFSLTTLLTRFSVVYQQTAFFRRGLFDRIGYLDESLNYLMDTDFWIRIALRGKGVYWPGVRAQSRLHGSSKTMAQQTGFWSERRRVMDALYASPDLPNEAHRARREAYAHCELYWGENLLADGQRTEARSHLWFAARTHPRLRRRALALALLLDAWLGTHMAAALRRARDAVKGPPNPWMTEL
jgi:GT2 family glycosyltransferase